MADTVRQALRAATVRLADTSDTARLDAEVIMAHVLGITRSDLLLRHQDDAVPSDFAVLVARRLRHEPVAYIVGCQEFYGLDFCVSPAVLIPRGDSEVLIDAARARFGDRAPARILDLGTGSGALLLTALSLWPQAQGIGLERSDAARAVAEANAVRLGVASRATILAGDWTQADWHAPLGRFDLILANPPYVEADARLAPGVRDHEPAAALFAGHDGLDDYRCLVPVIPLLLRSAGVALVEIGASQAEAVTALARMAGLSYQIHNDLAGRARAVEMENMLDISLGSSAAGL